MKAETLTIEKDILVYCVTADSFPDGIPKAHDALHQLFDDKEYRNHYGISRPEQGKGIVYKAAAPEKMQGELSSKISDSMLIAAGEYLYLDIPDFRNHIPAIAQNFDQLIRDPRIAPDGYCIEWYLPGGICRCMIRMK